MFNWTIFFSQIPRLILQSMLTIALSRLIPPHQFGIFATSIAILAGIEVLREFGLQQTSLVYGNMSNLQMSSLFWFRCIVAIFWTLVLFVIWIFLNILSIPSETLMTLLFIHPIILINTVQNFTSSILIQRDRYKLIIVSDFAGLVCGALMSLVLIRVSQIGYALPAGLLTSSVITTLIRWIGLRWRPTYSFDRLFVKELLKTNMISGPMLVLNFSSKNIDTLTLSIFASPVSLGYYNRAFQLIEVPLQQLLSATNDQVLKNSKENLDKQRTSYLFSQSVKLLVPISFALMFLAFNTQTVVPFLLGNIWNPSIQIIRIISIGALIQTLCVFSNWTYIAKGIRKEYLDYTTKIQLLKICLIAVGAAQGPIGAAVGYLLGHLGAYLVLTLGLHKRISGSATPFIQSQIVIVSISALSTFIGSLISQQLAIATITEILLTFAISAAIFCALGFMASKSNRSFWKFFSQKSLVVDSKKSVEL